MSFMEEEDPKCTGCGKVIRGRLDEHHAGCWMWHMKQVLAKKNQRKDKHGKQRTR